MVCDSSSDVLIHQLRAERPTPRVRERGSADSRPSGECVQCVFVSSLHMCVCMNSGSGCSHTLDLQHDSFCQLIAAFASHRTPHDRIKLSDECQPSKRLHTHAHARTHTHTHDLSILCFYVTDQLSLKASLFSRLHF